HTNSNNTSGKIATDPLLSMAIKNATRLSQYQRSSRPSNTLLLDCFSLHAASLAANCFASLFKYHQIETRKKNIDNTFWRCEIQATLSTFTGWRPQKSAAKNAPGIDSRLRIPQTRSVSTMCKMRLTT